ncbi:MAG: hypothetical protein RQ990_03990 [Candidatus Hydrothermia bacterium]|nr:hypothetical protein [Candidatus Hydrothermia bacterium]
MNKITISIALTLGVAFATETRVNVLTQNSNRLGYANFLLDDEYIIQFYPSALFKFPAHFTIEAPNIPMRGDTIYGTYAYASAFGKYQNYGFGAYLGRERVGIDFNRNGTADLTVTPLDLVGGLNFNNVSLGLNLRFGTTSFDDKGTPATIRTASIIGLTPSLSYYISEKTAFDISIPLQFGNGSDKTGTTVNTNYSSNSFGFLGRFYNPIFIGYALFLTGSEEYDNPNTNGTDFSTNTTQFSAGGGLNLPISDIGFGILGLTVNSLSQTTRQGNTETKSSGFSLGILIGGEVKALRDYFKLRGSFTYDLLRTADVGTRGTGLGSVGNLTLGFGYEVGFIRLDAAVSTDLIYNGPFFLTGVPSGFIPSISILGKF